MVEEIFCTLSEQQIRSSPNRRSTLQSLNMRIARCLILSHQVHLQSQIHCWIGRSPHHQTTPLERGRVPNTYVCLTADEGTTIIPQTHLLYTLHRRSTLAGILKASTWKREVTSSPPYLSARQFANWNRLRYQSVNQSINQSYYPTFLSLNIS